MTTEGIILGVCLGLLMAWKDKTFLQEPRFKNLIVAGTGAALFLIALKAAPSVPFLAAHFSTIHALLLFIMAVGCVIGRHPGYVSAGIGLALNGAVVALNGAMPVEAEALLKIGDSRALALITEGRVLTHSLANEATRLRFLGDRFCFSSAVSSAKVMSLGDGFIAFGLFLFVASATSYLFGKADHYAMDK